MFFHEKKIYIPRKKPLPKSSKKNQIGVLAGWKAVSRFVGCATRTLQKYHYEHVALPRKYLTPYKPKNPLRRGQKWVTTTDVVLQWLSVVGDNKVV